jgi:hypothetical protein
MLKSLLVFTIFAAALSACEQQKQASTEVGAIPKQTIDKVTEDIAKAQAQMAEKMQAAETESTPADNGK